MLHGDWGGEGRETDGGSSKVYSPKNESADAYSDCVLLSDPYPHTMEPGMSRFRRSLSSNHQNAQKKKKKKENRIKREKPGEAKCPIPSFFRWPSRNSNSVGRVGNATDHGDASLREYCASHPELFPQNSVEPPDSPLSDFSEFGGSGDGSVTVYFEGPSCTDGAYRMASVPLRSIPTVQNSRIGPIGAARASGLYVSPTP
ncbi:hypothetical protein BDM02DRAFT_2425096 [Thelephora ganbajun]|uniref:Uncharacterized protein n=1 Tax=Thelephora ganbajun TaxID=370292 RepID=A0ACB6ZU48_THEGA|nr:hypothetical protein BDM02DRAFT_2425096 [Thelephora ganbajun]